MSLRRDIVLSAVRAERQLIRRQRRPRTRETPFGRFVTQSHGDASFLSFVLPAFSSCANGSTGAHLALVLKTTSEDAPRDSIKTADGSAVLATFMAETGISASELAEAQALQVTVCLGLADAPSSEAVSFASVRVRRTRGHAIEQHLEISRALPRRATSPPPARPRLISCPSSSPEASLEVKHAARSAIESACSRRNLAQLVVALNAAVRSKLPSDDGAVKKGMALKVSCDRRSCQDVSSSGSHSANVSSPSD